MQATGYLRFKLDSKPAPHAYPIPNKFDVSARKIRLAAMLVHEAFEYRFNREVVLSRPCIYGVFGGRFGGFKPLRHKCVGCMRCVQEYPHIMTVRPARTYTELGDSFWTPEAVFTIWSEASTGKIPVKGMGYKGRFGGDGFDGIWTDMSEIVRPTRDGVYGREYISTSVDVGRKPNSLDFTKLDAIPKTLEIPVPIIFDEISTTSHNDGISKAIESASQEIGTLHVGKMKKLGADSFPSLPSITSEAEIDSCKKLSPRIIEFDTDEPELFRRLKQSLPNTILIGRLSLDDRAESVVRRLAAEGADGFHLYADYHGFDYSRNPKHISASLKEVHQKLVHEGLRDQVTIIASGGITLAEHVPKAIICGADLVGIDTTALVALQAEFLGETRDRTNCQLQPRKIDSVWAAQRLVNLICAWHDQLIEILGSMGMRDVRRLRGDVGRSMTDSELREQSFKGIEWAT